MNSKVVIGLVGLSVSAQMCADQYGRKKQTCSPNRRCLLPRLDRMKGKYVKQTKITFFLN